MMQHALGAGRSLRDMRETPNATCCDMHWGTAHILLIPALLCKC